LAELGGAWRSLAELGGAWRSLAELGGAWRSLAEQRIIVTPTLATTSL